MARKPRDEVQQGAGAAGRTMPTSPGTDPFDLDHHVFYWMTKVMGIRDRQLSGELRKYNLRVPEYRLLWLVRARRSTSIGEAALAAGMDQATMSRIVDKMVEAGRIQKLTDANDARVARLAPTAQGEKLFDEVWPIIQRLNREALARLPDGAIPLLCLAFREIAQAMEESWEVKGTGRRKRGEPGQS